MSSTTSSHPYSMSRRSSVTRPQRTLSTDHGCDSPTTFITLTLHSDSDTCFSPTPISTRKPRGRRLSSDSSFASPKLRSHWSDDSSEEEDDDYGSGGDPYHLDDDDAHGPAPPSPSPSEWRSRFIRPSFHRHSRSMVSPLHIVSPPRAKPVRRNSLRSREIGTTANDSASSFGALLEPCPMDQPQPENISRRPRKSVLTQFGQWPGFTPT
ncbi:hypothetical protein DL93DRAFT_2086092, partial [Clavulina sp. PMI_390]